MKISRMFFYDNYKGTKNYLRTQKKYEIARTLLYFAISLSLFLAGWEATKTRANLLTVVAVVGCLPACKSLLSVIMFLRYRGCSPENAEKIEAHSLESGGLYDLVFTSYDKNYVVAHLTVRGNTVCGFTQEGNFDEQGFYRHIDDILKKDNLREVSVKIFRDLDKYTRRLEEMQKLPDAEKTTAQIEDVLKSVSL